jgi:ABC-2 type transport system ATP-binding protein
MGVLVSTPYMDEAARCDRVALIHAGRILKEGVPSKLISEFDHAVLEVHAVDRSAIDRVLEAHPDVMAVTPAGERIRVVVPVSARGSVRLALEQVGAEAVDTPPDFEDLVLSLLTRRGGSA